MRLIRKPVYGLGAIVLMVTAAMSISVPSFAGDRLFTEQELAIMRGFYNWAEGESGGGDRYHYHDHDYSDDRGGGGKPGKGTPPGLAKKPGGLAPGHKKQLARGKGLPQGIAKNQLPDDLQHRMPPRSGSYIRIVDNDIVLIEAGTEIVLDILADAVRN